LVNVSAPKRGLLLLAGDLTASASATADHPEVVARLEAVAREQHTPSLIFPLPSVDALPKK
jgi:hypothetical protein